MPTIPVTLRAELIALADEANHAQSEDTQCARLHDGGTSFGDLQIMGGLESEELPVSELALTLRRTALMIDRGQLSLAREHAGTLADAATAERDMRPYFSRELRTVADELSELPSDQGLAVAPQETEDSLARTLATQHYASSANRHNVTR